MGFDKRQKGTKRIEKTILLCRKCHSKYDYDEELGRIGIKENGVKKAENFLIH